MKIGYLYGEQAEQSARILLGESVQSFDAQKGAVCLFSDETLIGILLFHYEDCPVIDRVNITEKERKKGYGDFLTRACLLSFSSAGGIRVSHYDKYYEQFAFEKEGEGMFVSASRLTFPQKCKQQKGDEK